MKRKLRRAWRNAKHVWESIYRLLAGYAIFVILVGGLMSLIEDGWSWADGIWWSQVTMTTTGYGDLYPETGLGRSLAGIIMICGIYFIALIVANAVSTRDKWTHDEQQAMFRKLHKIHCAVVDLSAEREKRAQ
jgi:hypothetical protein